MIRKVSMFSEEQYSQLVIIVTTTTSTTTAIHLFIYISDTCTILVNAFYS